jgi:hypothetical protein
MLRFSPPGLAIKRGAIIKREDVRDALCNLRTVIKRVFNDGNGRCKPLI